MSAPGATCTSRQPQLGIPITSARVALCGVHVVRLSFIILPRGLSMPLIACIISELMLCATKRRVLPDEQRDRTRFSQSTLAH